MKKLRIDICKKEYIIVLFYSIHYYFDLYNIPQK